MTLSDLTLGTRYSFTIPGPRLPRPAVGLREIPWAIIQYLPTKGVYINAHNTSSSMQRSNIFIYDFDISETRCVLYRGKNDEGNECDVMIKLDILV